MILRPVDTIEIPTADAFAVRADLYLPSSRAPEGLVIVCHGFKAWKTWGFLPFLANCLRDAGLAALVIDFSFNGTSPNKRDGDAQQGTLEDTGPPSASLLTQCPRPDLFRNNTIDREYNDLGAVIEFIETGRLAAYLPKRIVLGLFGHSRGGVVAMLHALENDSIGALCTWSIPGTPDFYTPRQKENWRREGEYRFTDSRDGTKMSLSVRYLDDLEQNRDKYFLSERAVDLHTPHLIVHGEMDLAFDVECARTLHAAERNLIEKRLLIVKSGHTLGAVDSPDDTSDAPGSALLEATGATVDWFNAHLKKGP